MVQRSLGGGEVHGCEVPLRFKATHICQRVEGSPNKFHVLLTMVGTCHSLTRRPATLCARNFLRPLSMQVMRRQSIEMTFEEEAAIDMFAVGVVPSWQLILLPAFAMPVNFPGAHEQCALMAAYVPRVKTCDIRKAFACGGRSRGLHSKARRLALQQLQQPRMLAEMRALATTQQESERINSALSVHMQSGKAGRCCGLSFVPRVCILLAVNNFQVACCATSLVPCTSAGALAL
jgi:hypothetical protein